MEQPSLASRLFSRKMVNHFFIHKSSNTFIQIFRYTCAGGVAFIADFCSLFILTEYLGIHYLLSAALAFFIGVATKYTFCIRWVFDRRAIRSRWIEFIVFGMIGVTGFGLNMAFMWFFTEKAQFHYLASKIISSGAVFLWNFFTRKFTLFT